MAIEPARTWLKVIGHGRIALDRVALMYATICPSDRRYPPGGPTRPYMGYTEHYVAVVPYGAPTVALGPSGRHIDHLELEETFTSLQEAEEAIEKILERAP